MLLWLMVGLGAVVVAYIFMNNEHKGKLLTLGEFESGIENNTYNPTNVFDLKIMPGYIRFQDQPAEKHGGTADETKPVHVVSVPTYMMGSEKEAELTELFHSQ